MPLTTRTKIYLAGLVSRGVRIIRRLFGKSASGVFRRRGLIWELDLNEGIDFSIYLLGGFELSTRREYTRLLRPGSVIFDIGANIGAHTLPLARLAGEDGVVHAFEATEFAIRKLERNLQLNPRLGKRVHIHHCLLTDGISEISVEGIHSSWPLESNPGTVHPDHGGRLKAIGKSHQFSIDQFVRKTSLQRIDFVKLDVDGFEWVILKGMTETIEKFHPDLLFELAPSYSLGDAKDILSFFWERGYHLYPMGSDNPYPRDSRALLQRVPGKGSLNVLARHGRSPAD